SKTCKCTNVEVALTPSYWKDWSTAVAANAANLLLLGAGGSDRFMPAALVSAARPLPEPSADWQPLPEKSTGFEVPARATGWVRINWKNDNPGPQLLQVKLWTLSQGGITELTVPISFV